MFNETNKHQNVMKFPKPVLLIGEQNQSNFLNKLMECQDSSDSFICIATKEETLNVALKDREDQENWFYSPIDKFNTKIFNWIPLCEQDEIMVLALARTILANNKEKNMRITGGFVDEYFEQKTFFLAALFAHANTLNSANQSSESSLCNFVSEFKNNPRKLLYLLLGSENELARKFAKAFMRENPHFLEGLIWYSVDEGLGWIKEIEKEFLGFNANAVETPDFGKLRKEKVGVCLDLTKLEGLAKATLGGLFVELALQRLKAVREGQTVYLFVDDLTVGKIPYLTIHVEMIRAFGIGLVMAVPSLDKLERFYGRNDAKIILGNTLGVEAEGLLEGVLA